MTNEETLKLALEALETYHGYMEPLTTVFGGPRVPAEQSTTGKVETAITSLRQALEEALAKQEQDEKRKLLPRCFADYQPNHTHDRKCEWCAVNTECQTGEQPKQEPDYKALWKQMCERCDELDAKLAKQEQELALQKLHDENERLGLYKDAYGEEYTESVRLQCVVCNTVYADGVPPQIAKQEPVAEPHKGEPEMVRNMRMWTIDSLEQEIYENTREFVSFNVMEWLLTRFNTTPQQRNKD